MDILDDLRVFRAPTSVSARATGVRWGAIAGFAGIFFYLIFHQIAINAVKVMGLSAGSWVVAPVYFFYLFYMAVNIYFCYRAIKYSRDVESGGYISLGKCVMLGVWMGLVAGIIVAGYDLLNVTFIHPRLITKDEAARKEARDKLIEAGQTRRSANAAMGYFDGPDPKIITAITFIRNIIGYVVYAFFVGLLMKRDLYSSV